MLELDNPGYILQSRLKLDTPLLSLSKNYDEAFQQNHIAFVILVAIATLFLHQRLDIYDNAAAKTQQPLFTNPTTVTFLNEMEKQDDELSVTVPESTMDLF